MDLAEVWAVAQPLGAGGSCFRGWYQLCCRGRGQAELAGWARKTAAMFTFACCAKVKNNTVKERR